MTRTTIDFGIDLGTTNSAVAMLSEGRPVVLRNNDQLELTPSAVMVERDGTIVVGSMAYKRAEVRPDAVAREFKRAMGTERTFTLSGRTFRPEELSAEVLKSLRTDVQLRTGEPITAAVVTVPAMFTHSASDATVRASRLAGLEQVVLLQEPIAAGLAYSLTVEAPDGYWLVYDLGGGTFDVSVMALKSSRLRVLDHSGDESLGGRDFDNALVDLVVERLRANYRFPAVLRGDGRYARLKLVCEQAKIALSRLETTVVDITGVKDDEGREVDTEVPVSRSEYERLIEPQLRKTVRIIKDTLKRSDLPASAIAQIILVGGPTLTPIVRRLLLDETGITLDPRVDPMTVVAQGAAILSGTVPIERAAVTSVAKDAIPLELKFDPVSEDTETHVGGRVALSGGPAAGLSIEITRDDGAWSSGRVPISNGRFVTPVMLRRKQVNGFHIRLVDSTGRVLPTTPDQLTIAQGVVPPDPVLSRTIGVAVEATDSEAPRTVRLLEKGTRLPAHGQLSLRTTRSLAPGQLSGINIHIVEGESDRADRNDHAGYIRIDGQNLNKALPLGSEVELTFSVDTSRRMTVEAFVPLLDQTLPKVIDNVDRPIPASDVLREVLSTEQERLAGVTDHASLGEVPWLIAEAEAALLAADVDPDAAVKAQRRIRELQQQIDRAYDVARIPLLKDEFEQFLPEIGRALTDFGDRDERQRADTVAKDFATAIEEGDGAAAALKLEQLRSLYFGILLQQDGWWIGLYQDLVERQAQLQDQNLARVLILEGRKALEQQDFSTLRQVCSRLWTLLPEPSRAGMSRALPDVGVRVS